MHMYALNHTRQDITLVKLEQFPDVLWLLIWTAVVIYISLYLYGATTHIKYMPFKPIYIIKGHK